jgi:spore germination protein GerM
MKKITLFLPLIVFLLTSCSFQNTKENDEVKKDQDLRKIEVFFTDSKESKNKDSDLSFIAVKREIKKDENEIEAGVTELLLGPTQKEEKSGIMSEIPVGTRLIKVEESEDEILVDLSNQYLTGGGSASVQVRYLQLFKTINNLSPNKKIFLQIEGKDPKTIAGEGLEVSQPLKKIEDYTEKFEKTEDLQP